VCGIKCAGGTLEELEIVSKVLRSLPDSYKHKVAAIEEIRTISYVTRDHLVGKISAFELSEFVYSLPKYEFAFKASVYGKQRYDLGESSSTRSNRFTKTRNDLKDVEIETAYLEALLAKRLPRGSGKYEWKLPLKCFACNKIGHFASRCPERFSKQNPNRYKNQNKCYYVQETREEGVTYDESSQGGSPENDWVFIAIKEEDPMSTKSTSYANI